MGRFLAPKRWPTCEEGASFGVHGRRFQLWGLDQPLLGSAGWLRDEILATHPGPNATKVITELKKKEESDAELAQQTGDPIKLMLVSADGAELEKARGILQREGSPTARALLEELIESRVLYLKNLWRLRARVE